jgi:hypothetical protein
VNALRSAYENKVVYDRLYRLCRQLHDAFRGLGRSTDLSEVMKKLIGIRETQATHQA